MTADTRELTPFGRELEAFLSHCSDNGLRSRNKIAKRAGVAASDVSRMSTGKTRLTLRVLHRIADVIGWDDATVGRLAMSAESEREASSAT